jgi:large subunit ribosomal protein L25
MKSINVKGTIRKELGKKQARKIRQQEHVPCVMYGGEGNVHFSAHENELKEIVYTPDVYIIDFELEGKKRRGVIKDIQFHPVSDKVQHIDFTEVVENKPVTMAIPIKLTGNSIGLKNGGKLRIRRRYLTVQGDADNLPDRLEVDITKLKIGQVFKIEDLSFANLDLLDPEKSMVVGVVSSRVVAKGSEIEEEEGEEGTEGSEGAESEEKAEAATEEATS